LKRSLLKWSFSDRSFSDGMDLNLHSVFVFILGCVIGSFLNVVRYRLPRKTSVAAGRSTCPNCGHVISWYDNIPLVSFIALRGRCRSCGWKIPVTYVVTEIATGLGFLLIWWAFDPAQAIAYWVLAAILIACAGIDHDLGLIPDKLTVPGLVLGLIFSVTLLRAGSPARSLIHSALGMLVGGGSLLAISVIYKKLRRRDGMGGGDVMLMAMVGAFLGYKLALLTIFVASLAGGIAGIFVARRSAKGMLASIRFGVFLSPAALVALLWGEDLIRAYINTIT
jgi:leader peptidase (prepilin peptidase)/N-methyltransferase